MRIIKDCNGNEWKIDLNIYTAKSLVNYLESIDPPVNLFDAASFLPRASSILFAVDCLAVLTYEERTARGVSDVDFGRGLKGSYAYEAQRALMSEYTEFFPDPSLSETLKKTLTALEETSLREQQIVESLLIQAVKDRERQVEQLAQEIGSDISPS